MKAHEDILVQSHLVRIGFVKDYTFWSFHGKKLDASGGASRGNSLSSTVVNANHGGQPASSSIIVADGHGVAGDNANHDYIR
jgi:hypothetical protein